MDKTQTKNKTGNVVVPFKILETILEELRSLRNEVKFLFPQESVEDFNNPEEIKNSYKKAIKEYPPVSL